MGADSFFAKPLAATGLMTAGGGDGAGRLFFLFNSFLYGARS